MIWLRLKQWLTGRSPRPQAAQPARVEERLSPELKCELAELAVFLKQQHVAVRDVATDEAIPDTPQLEDTPLPH